MGGNILARPGTVCYLENMDAGEVDVRSALTTSDIFSGLSSDQIDKLVPLTSLCPVYREELLFTTGQTAKSLYILAQGIVSLELSFNACTHIVELCGPGKVLGWPALRYLATYNLTARPIKDGKALVLEGGPLRRILTTSSEIALLIYRNLAEILGRRWETMAISEARVDTLQTDVERCPQLSNERFEPYLAKEDVQTRCLRESACMRLKGENCPLDDLTPSDWYQIILNRILIPHPR